MLKQRFNGAFVESSIKKFRTLVLRPRNIQAKVARHSRHYKHLQECNRMKTIFKIASLLVCAALITNCAAKKSQGVQAGVDNSQPQIENSGVGDVNEPLVAQDSLLKATDIPNDILQIIQQPPKEAGFISKLFGGSGCGLLNTALSVGASYFMGGLPFASSLVPMLTNLLFKCGSNSSLAGLIPGGASSSNQIFTILSQVLQTVDGGKDPFALINGIKNPQDLKGIMSIVSGLLAKNNDPKLQNILNLVNGFMGKYDGSIGTCGNMNTVACEVFNIVNQIREQKGLHAFLPNNNCTAAAQSHSKDMFTNGILSHLSSNGMTADERLENFGVLGAWAENIVKGSNLTPAQAVQMWLNSQGHAKNLLSADFKSMGVGFLNGYFTQCITM